MVLNQGTLVVLKATYTVEKLQHLFGFCGVGLCPLRGRTQFLLVYYLASASGKR